MSSSNNKSKRRQSISEASQQRREEKQKATIGDAAAQRELYAREIEFFGYSPLEVVDDILNAVNTYTGDVLDALERGLLSVLGPSHELTISQAFEKVLPIFTQSCDKNFDRWELYVLRNIFVVPPQQQQQTQQLQHQGVPLPEEVMAVLEGPQPTQTEQQLDAELEELQKRILQTHAMNQLLKKQKAILAKEEREAEQHATFLEHMLPANCKPEEFKETLHEAIQRRNNLVPLVEQVEELDLSTPTLHIHAEEEDEASSMAIASKHKRHKTDTHATTTGDQSLSHVRDYLS
ncbi:hypothetical protein QOT17_023249 [Balamuthia mandrillaris]